MPAIKAGAEREAAIAEHFPLVRTIARRLKRMLPAADFDDLIGDGCLGLIRAFDTFDSERGTEFASFAKRVIVGAMLNGLRRLDPVPERARRKIRAAENERYALAMRTGRMPSHREMEPYVGGLPDALTAAYRCVPLSLDGPLPKGERLASDWSGDPAGIVVERCGAALMAHAVASLPQRQQSVMRRHYFAEQSLHAIARDMNVSPQRASQLHLAALERLRRELPAP